MAVVLPNAGPFFGVSSTDGYSLDSSLNLTANFAALAALVLNDSTYN